MTPEEKFIFDLQGYIVVKIELTGGAAPKALFSPDRLAPLATAGWTNWRCFMLCKLLYLV